MPRGSVPGQKIKNHTEASLAQRRANVKAIAERRRAKTHCKRGHEYTKENTIWKVDGRRNCRTCHNDWLWCRYNNIDFKEWADRH